MNFDFIKPFPEFAKLYSYCDDAESFALSRPNISATSSRKAIEFIVKLLYSSKISSYDAGFTVFEMLTDQRFVDYISDPTVLNSLHYIRKMGNVAVHDGTLTAAEAVKILEELHFIVGEVFILLGNINDYDAFVAPGTKIAPAAPAKPVQQETVEKIIVASELVARYAERMRYTRFNVKHGRDESENKKLFLCASLREAGWAMVSQSNQAMPCAAGLNIMLDDGDSVDYVLYGRDNRPLAVVEYTATVRDLIDGRTKGIEKANKLEVKYGYKPVVYYTNGYYIYCIDQLGYKPRRVFCFHTIDELELLKLRASIRKDISHPQIDDSITDRPYQHEAIEAACKAYTQMRRHSLLVMATGTGKTRVAISCVDVLMKANWVKNVLFLADRTSLVRQAHKNFNKLLPNITTSIYSGGEERDENARIIFSTYQTMINLVNDDTREFGIGRFDLIIVDEAHRSIFNKYGALFHYFDALVLGLTATPRSEDNKSTYQIFELPDGEPDFDYELETAVNNAPPYLVGFDVQDRTTDKMRRGIKYDSLSPEEKAKLEDAFATGDDEALDFLGAEIQGEKIGRSVINLGTINAMLNDLMKSGLKIEGGDKLGKTIIFASSHVEAEKIVERFYSLYPELGADFCALIDSRVEDGQHLIDLFEVRESLPQIAVSVDMLDTGIDVPDVLNLVFFKPVRSKIKFLQMIGRGTRLSPDIFGPGLDKKGFEIFDYYDNFNYFSARGIWTVGGFGRSFSVTPQTVLLNMRRLSILRGLQEESTLCAFDSAYRDELHETFISEIRSLNNDSIEVQYNMAFVSKYRTAENWDALSDAAAEEIVYHILPLFPSEQAPVKVKSFDMLMLVVEDEYSKREREGKDPRKIRNGFINVGDAISQRMEELLKLKTIPAVMQKEKLIQSMIDADYILDNFSLERAESVRKELRELMPYIPDDKRYYIIDVDDWVEDTGTAAAKEKPYSQKAMEYLQSANTPALAKMRNLDELTEDEKKELSDVFTVQLGTAADFAGWSGNKPLLVFIRLQIGIADEALTVKFGSFLNASVMNGAQLTYLNQIIDYARRNGDITATILLKESPFCDADVMKLFGDKFPYVKQLINGLHHPVM